MGLPASRTSVSKPFSQSSLAAQPPVIPEPTTMASYVFVDMIYFEASADKGAHPAWRAGMISSCNSCTNQIDEFIYPRSLGPWSVGLRNNQFTDSHHGRVLVGIEGLERRCLRKLLVHFLEQRKCVAGNKRQSGSGSKQSQGFTSLHALSY